MATKIVKFPVEPDNGCYEGWFKTADGDTIPALELVNAANDNAELLERFEQAMERGHTVYISKTSSGEISIDVSGEISEHKNLLDALKAVPR